MHFRFEAMPSSQLAGKLILKSRSDLNLAVDD
jgi:hypothetical protein